jgi:dTDP-4-amino-4,6-dideoxygalactose transaminase
MHQDILPKLLGDNLADTLISLPIGEHLVEEDILNVTKLIKDFFQH